MDIFEQKEILNSFEVLVDTREQPTLQAKARYESMCVPVRRATLNYGDYTYQLQLKDGKLLLEDEAICGLTVIERKMSLDELAMCFGKDRARFEREFERAKANCAKVWLLVENATWENLINGKYRSKMNPKAFYSSLVAWAIRYDLGIIFCKAETSGKIIKEILYRDAKERLEQWKDG